jgi:hypothetical protein
MADKCVLCECLRNNGISRSIFSSGIKTHANRCRFDICTLNAYYTVTNPVYHVLRVAPGLVNTEVIVKCPALYLAAIFHVINVAPRSSPVDINAQEPVVKCVLRGIAINVPINLMLE